jgi:hypothetical protein
LDREFRRLIDRFLFNGASLVSPWLPILHYPSVTNA